MCDLGLTTVSEQVLTAVERSWLGAGAVPVRVAADAGRQLGCVVLREPWRVALFDMAEAEEGEEGEGSGGGEACDEAPPAADSGGQQRACAQAQMNARELREQD